jgi:hypothetical protein
MVSMLYSNLPLQFKIHRVKTGVPAPKRHIASVLPGNEGGGRFVGGMLDGIRRTSSKRRRAAKLTQIDVTLGWE